MTDRKEGATCIRVVDPPPQLISVPLGHKPPHLLVGPEGCHIYIYHVFLEFSIFDLQ